MIVDKAKKIIKKSSLNKIIRPRKFHVFGVGAPKTGTHSIARLFGNFRSSHEGLIVDMIHLARRKQDGHASTKEVYRYIKHRDQNQRWEADIAHPLIYFAEELVELYPEAKFIVTVRHPRNWLRSMTDLSINHSWPKDVLATDARYVWKVHRETNLGSLPDSYPPEENPLKERSVRPISSFLEYWRWHNEKALRAIPTERCLMIQTKDISQSLDSIASFVGVDEDGLDQTKSHSWSTKEKHDVLSNIEESYVDDKIKTICEGTVERLNTRLKSEIGLL